MKKKKKNPLVALKKKLWKLCKIKTRERYGNCCYTCGRTGLSGSNWHTGHMIPKSICGAYLKYDLRNLRPQCYHCNINLGGNGAAFLRNMDLIEGGEYVEKLYADAGKICKESDRVTELIAEYSK